MALEPDIASRGPVGITLPRLDLALEQSATICDNSMLRAEAMAVRGRARLETGELPTARQELEAARERFKLLRRISSPYVPRFHEQSVWEHPAGAFPYLVRQEPMWSRNAGPAPFPRARALESGGLFCMEAAGIEPAPGGAKPLAESRPYLVTARNDLESLSRRVPCRPVLSQHIPQAPATYVQHGGALRLRPDRSAPTLEAWLRRHPGVKVLTRDRSTEYARAAAAGTPKARQVADRWHLLLNARQMVERWLTGTHARLRALP